MPRKKGAVGKYSAFQQVQLQARVLLAGLKKDINNKQAELGQLKDEESRLRALVGSVGANPVGRPPSVARPAAAAPAAAGASGRIIWRSVLTQLPRQFKASDVRKVRGLKQKRPSEIFAAITRWIDGGMAKRKTRGLYEKA
jgi:hypothetical protein